ncbi:MAG: hypothetical protein FWH18_05690 [Marinilabiliaceae bacterium]|nr:hypothetical protein [Marinilabiliaceae bacterium]
MKTRVLNIIVLTVLLLSGACKKEEDRNIQRVDDHYLGIMFLKMVN